MQGLSPPVGLVDEKPYQIPPGGGWLSGRALRLHRRCRRFDPVTAYQGAYIVGSPGAGLPSPIRSICPGYWPAVNCDHDTGIGRTRLLWGTTNRDGDLTSGPQTRIHGSAEREWRAGAFHLVRFTWRLMNSLPGTRIVHASNWAPEEVAALIEDDRRRWPAGHKRWRLRHDPIPLSRVLKVETTALKTPRRNNGGPRNPPASTWGRPIAAKRPQTERRKDRASSSSIRSRSTKTPLLRALAANRRTAPSVSLRDLQGCLGRCPLRCIKG